ncbi:glycosyltransferase [Gynuella sunshinyii]|uniref:Glycosyltransferase, probably involved in cell wall biogenesis n=1 Tax=Gynuella sunshinyii YC6258 TaxID=1445510 RepID=A0A0C5VRE4_9GAMM|nr:glycosyltransferase [Gynuella sunshinyii]AJQ92814.1 glycosyltransferase, probably involved in cell wall biogenesis [Gynuella sunshinyii YC6258]
MNISIGIFAHNEEQNIEKLIHYLSVQTIVNNTEHNMHVFVLANGCSDFTVDFAKRKISSLPKNVQDKFQVVDIELSGKSRCWNYFVHNILKSDVDVVYFMDADILLPETDTLNKMLDFLTSENQLKVVVSKPVKDLDIKNEKLSFTEKLIKYSGGNLTNYKKSVCGQLYLTKYELVRHIWLPIGLPVEDGFLRAMFLTDLLTKEEHLEIIDGRDDIYHVYMSIRGIGELISHQTRIMIGTAINELIFNTIRTQPDSMESRTSYLANISTSETWLKDLIRENLPKWPYGYIAFKHVTKRLRNAKTQKMTPKRALITGLGLLFDALVYVNASLKMLSGKGAGHW